MDNLKQVFGNNVRQFRLRKGLTQVTLATATNLTEETISNIERGKTGTQFSGINKLASALGVEEWQLFYFPG
jgi:transcriptional regulator with XRE-family HTH domain